MNQLTRTLLATTLTGTLFACGGETTEMPPPGTSQGSITCDDALNLCTVKGTFTEDLTWTADRQYRLLSNVFIGDDVNKTTLTIQPGTVIFGDFDTQSALIIRRNSEIQAVGTAALPILFTSGKLDGARGRGDWGGLVINGNAPVNCGGSSAECEGEGNSGKYGGTNATDSSGRLAYVRVEFAGVQFNEEDEFNGVAFQGVGSGTQIDHLHVHMIADDGIEFFGGSVSAKHLMVTGAGDDSIDWTFGWNGKVQFAVVQQFTDEANRGIEADNNSKDNSASPRSRPTFSNVTLVGTGANAEAAKADHGILLRAGTEAHIHNTIVYNFKADCMSMADDETFNNAWDGSSANPGNIKIEDSMFYCPDSMAFSSDAEDPWSIETFVMMGNMGNSSDVDPMLTNPMAMGADADFRPKAGSTALSGAMVPSDSFFEQVGYRGALDDVNDWTKWMQFPMN